MYRFLYIINSITQVFYTYIQINTNTVLFLVQFSIPKYRINGEWGSKEHSIYKACEQSRAVSNQKPSAEIAGASSLDPCLDDPCRRRRLMFSFLAAQMHEMRLDGISPLFHWKKGSESSREKLAKFIWFQFIRIDHF